MRDRIYKTLSDENNTTIEDSTSVDWSNFIWSTGYYTHKVSTLEIQKPYLISSAYYGTIDYEDIILLLNGIEDPFEIIPESSLKIPKEEDIKQFILNCKM